MHILFFSAQFLPHVGGVENYTYNLGRELIKLGHDVSVITCNTANAASKEVMENIQVYRMESYNLLNGRFPILKKNQFWKDCVASLLDSVDFIIINTRFYTISLHAARLASRKKIPFLMIEHGTAHLTVQNPIFDWLGRRYEFGITRFIKRYCDSFYGVSKASSNWLKKFGIKSKGELYNSIDLAYVGLLCQSKSDLIQLTKEKGIRLVYTGRLVKEKGLIQLCKAVEQWNKTHDMQWIDLYLIGDGPLFSELKVYQQIGVHLLGRLPFEQVIPAVASADVFVLPSDSEGFSTSMLEAVACKTFVFATNRGGARELIPNDHFGLLIEQNTVEEILAHLECLFSMNLDQAVNNAYEQLTNNFTWEKTANKLLNVIERQKEAPNV